MTTRDEAFAALRKAGLKHDDPDIVAMFDIEVPDFVAKAKATKPGLFTPVFDARTATEAEVKAALRDIERDDFRRRRDARGAATMATLQREHEDR